MLQGCVSPVLLINKFPNLVRFVQAKNTQIRTVFELKLYVFSIIGTSFEVLPNIPTLGLIRELALTRTTCVIKPKVQGLDTRI